MAFSSGLSASARATARSSSSAGLTSRLRTSSANPRPSCDTNSSIFMACPPAVPSAVRGRRSLRGAQAVEPGAVVPEDLGLGLLAHALEVHELLDGDREQAIGVRVVG